MGNCNDALCCNNNEINFENELHHSIPPAENLVYFNIKQDNFSDENFNINNLASTTRSGNLPYYNFDDEEYLKMENDIFDLINEMKSNPENFIKESKTHNLFSIFIKLTPSNKFNKSDLPNIINIKSYLYLNSFQEKALSIKEKEIFELIHDEIKCMSLFQYANNNKNINEIVWEFLEENEDDIENIFANLYDYLLVVCIPTIYTSQNITYFLFYSKK